MGVETTVYSIPPKLMRKIRANNDNMSFLLEIDDENENKDWKVESYSMGRVLVDALHILHESGYTKTAKILNLDNYFYSDNTRGMIEYDGYDIWIIPPAKVKTVSQELEPATFEQLKDNGLAKQLTADRDGAVIPEQMYSYYIGDIKDVKKFFKKAGELGHYLVFVEA